MKRFVWWKIGLVIGLTGIGGWVFWFNKVHPSSRMSMRQVQRKETVQNKTFEKIKPMETLELGDGVKLEFVLIRPGSFMMGTAGEVSEEDEAPQHQVTITEPFYLGKYEVTQEQWQKIMGENPSRFKGGQNPVDSVSWNDCQQFLSKLRSKTGRQIILPTEAQWEYACRAGSMGRWSFGNQETQLKDYAWFEENAKDTTHPIGQKRSNVWGLYDMYGNLQEWCNDLYQNPYSSLAVRDPRGAAAGESRVLRGGAWGDPAGNSRSAYRNCSGPENGTDGTGLRCVMLISEIN